MCGVGMAAFVGKNNGYGLSPRVRGRFGMCISSSHFWRFIPACAGWVRADRDACNSEWWFIPACAG